MSVMTHLWVSPRGRHTSVSNHTAWVANLFGTTLPDVADPEYQAEENKLYDMAYRANLMRVLADHGRHTLYVDNLVTGDHYRWISREGARGHYLVLDTDGKEVANFTGKKQKAEEGLAEKRFIMHQPKLPNGYKVTATRQALADGVTHWWVGNVWQDGRFLSSTVTAHELKGPALKDAMDLAWLYSKHDLKESQRLIQRLKLGLGVQAYVREAIDVKDFIIKQPVFHVFQSGDQWAVAVRKTMGEHPKPVPKSLSSWSHILGYIKPYGTSPDGMSAKGWKLASIAVREMLPFSGPLWSTLFLSKEAAAESLWEVYSKLQEAAPESVKKWIVGLKEPPAREIEYQVWHGLDQQSHGHAFSGKPLKTLRAATLKAWRSRWSDASIQSKIVIRKVHVPTGHVFMSWQMTPEGGLRPLEPDAGPAVVNARSHLARRQEGIDPKKFIADVPEPHFYVRKQMNRHRGKPETFWLRITGGIRVLTFHREKASAFTGPEAEAVMKEFGGGEYDLVQEAIDVKQYTLQNAGEMIFYINEYVTNEHSDRDQKPLRIGYGTEIEGDEAKARKVAVNLARVAIERPQKTVLRVELEYWDIPAAIGIEAKLLHTYLVKADGTFEEIAGPADPTRSGVAGGGH